jgi:hypothetical protein
MINSIQFICIAGWSDLFLIIDYIAISVFSLTRSAGYLFKSKCDRLKGMSTAPHLLNTPDRCDNIYVILA